MESAASRKRRPEVLTWRVGAAPKKKLSAKNGQLAGTATATTNANATANTPQSAIEQHQHFVLQLANPRIREIPASLDPFCPLPSLLTREDRALLHCYLLEIPARAYGTRSDTIFSAVRDVSFPISLGSSLTLWWMLIAADALLTKEHRAESVSWRKRRAYRLLNGYIANGGGFVGDDLMGGIIMAAITEARLADPVACHAHLKGFEAAIRARGGLQASLVCPAIPAVRQAHLMPYLVCPPLPGDELFNDSIEHFVTFLVSKIRQKGGVSGCSVDANGLLKVDNCHPVQGAARMLLHSVLASYLRSDGRRASRFMDEAASFLSLFWVTLTLSLCETGNSIHNGRLFASRVIAVFKSSTAFDVQTGLPLLTDQGFMWVVLRAIQDFYRMAGNCFEGTDTQVVVDGIETLCVFRTLGRNSRTEARMLLFRILSGEDVVLPN